MSATQQFNIVRNPESEFPSIRPFNEHTADGTRTVGVLLWRTHVSVSWRRKYVAPTGESVLVAAGTAPLEPGGES